MAALTSLPSKVVRAFRYYLVSSGAVTMAQSYHQWDSRARKFNNGDPSTPNPIVDVWMRPVGPEEQYSGNDVFIVEVQVKFQATEQPSDAAESHRVLFDAQIGAVRQKLMLVDGQELIPTRQAINQAAYAMPTAADDAANGFLAANQADMNDFTILSLYQDVYGSAKAEDANWAIVMRFKVSACESKVDGYS